MRTLLIVVFALGVVATPAWAKPKVAMTPIEGDDSGKIGDAINDALDGSDVDLISPKAVTRAMDKLGYEGALNEKEARKLGKELEVQAVVMARYEKAGKHKVLRFKLVVGGKKGRGFKVTFNNPKNENFKTKLRDTLVERITGKSEAVAREEDPPKKPKDEDEDEETGKGKGKGGDEEADAGKGKSKGKGKGDDADEGDEDEDTAALKKSKKKKVAVDDEGTEPDDDEEAAIEASVRRVSPHAANRVAVRLDVGVSVQNRQVTYNSRADFPEAPKPYKNAPVPGARFETELYPLAFANPKSFAAGLGVAAEYDQTLSLTLRTTAESNTPVKATQLHWGAGLRYRLVFGGKPTSPSVTLGAGIGRRRFKTDRSALMNPDALDVPDSYYQYVDPGLSFRIPLAQVIALTFGGKALLIYDAGAIQKPYSYGQAKVFGASAQAGLDIVLGNRFAIRLVGELTQVGFDLLGKGQLSNGRDGDITTKDVGGIADRAVGGAATLAVLY